MPNDQLYDTRTTNPLSILSQNITANLDYQEIPSDGGGGDVIVGTGPALAPDGSLIFDSDFDNHPDWNNQHNEQRVRFPGDTFWDGSNGYIGVDNLPIGWDYMYCSERWHPNGNKNGDEAFSGSKPVGEISNALGNHLSPTGKAFITWDESYPGGWGSECELFKELPEQYLHLYAESYIMFPADFEFDSILNGSGNSTYKIMRFGRTHAGPTDNRFTYFSPTPHNHWFIMKLKTWTQSPGNTYSQIDNQIFLNPWCESCYTGPKRTSIDIGIGTSDPRQTFASGQWLKFNHEMIMNSEAGVADGVLRIWVNDILNFENTAIEWNPVPADNGTGFNAFTIGGNGWNTPRPESDMFEQPWAISGFKVWNGRPV